MDHTFNGLFISLGQAMSVVTITASVGKLCSDYYFYPMMFIVSLMVILISYVDQLRKQPQHTRGPLQNYLCSLCEGGEGKVVHSALYGILDQQKALVPGAHRNKATLIKNASTGKFKASNSNLYCESPSRKIDKKAKKS